MKGVRRRASLDQSQSHESRSRTRTRAGVGRRREKYTCGVTSERGEVGVTAKGKVAHRDLLLLWSDVAGFEFESGRGQL
eukprot:3589498-Pyramimonas_sp.AAC.1